jgi:hypothetical protein
VFSFNLTKKKNKKKTKCDVGESSIEVKGPKGKHLLVGKRNGIMME